MSMDMRGLIEADWLVHGNWERLHYAALDDAALAKFEDNYAIEGVTFACGKKPRGTVFIPGLITRMHAQRCPGCCDARGLPRGKGSPKNDDACRAILWPGEVSR